MPDTLLKEPMHLDLYTFQEWSDKGYKIKKGEKAIRVNSIPLFSRNQVEKYSPREESEGNDYAWGVGYWEWMHYKD